MGCDLFDHILGWTLSFIPSDSKFMIQTDGEQLHFVRIGAAGIAGTEMLIQYGSLTLFQHSIQTTVDPLDRLCMRYAFHQLPSFRTSCKNLLAVFNRE